MCMNMYIHIHTYIRIHTYMHTNLEYVMMIQRRAAIRLCSSGFCPASFDLWYPSINQTAVIDHHLNHRHAPELLLQDCVCVCM